jgi:hypothetical protein
MRFQTMAASRKIIAIYDVMSGTTPDVVSMGDECAIDALMMPIRRHPKPPCEELGTPKEK